MGGLVKDNGQQLLPLQLLSQINAETPQLATVGGR